MNRKIREHYQRALVLAQALTIVGRFVPTVHSNLSRDQRRIFLEDAEAAINGPDARIVAMNMGHPEGPTYRIAGRRANGDLLYVVVAFSDEDIEAATELRIVTVMYPE